MSFLVSRCTRQTRYGNASVRAARPRTAAASGGVRGEKVCMYKHEHKRTSIQTDSLHSQVKHPCRELREPLKNLFSLLSKMRVDRISLTRMI